VPGTPANDPPSIYPGRSGNVADPSQVDMQNRLVAGNLAGAVTARCRTRTG